jgi:hypothetical protein
MAGFDRSEDGEARHEGRSRRRGPPGGFNGGGMGSGTGGSERGTGPGGGEDRPEPGMRPAMAMSGPPVAIHLRFTNRGSTAADLRIMDFLSPLGNFVVHPSSLRLEPGQSLEVEPMASGLASEAGSGEITLSLQLDDIRETKAVTLQSEAASNPPIKP